LPYGRTKSPNGAMGRRVAPKTVVRKGPHEVEGWRDAIRTRIRESVNQKRGTDEKAVLWEEREGKGRTEGGDFFLNLGEKTKLVKRTGVKQSSGA